MSRSQRKTPYINSTLIKQVMKTRKEKPAIEWKEIPIKLYDRASTIFNECVGLSFAVHNGKSFILVSPNEEMIGHKFGEFSLTKKSAIHTVGKSLKKPIATKGSKTVAKKKK